MAAGLRLGVGPRGTYLLTTRGRRSGQPRTTPVTRRGGRRWRAEVVGRALRPD
ncbi:MAG: nitroreductase family deazaflavin-dependent oxidoreductase [Actinomycetota bacterium]|nr:nitroreductase family deazaflavin-dependent oxidoreductase [Actinomycetota bacterium]